MSVDVYMSIKYKHVCNSHIWTDIVIFFTFICCKNIYDSNLKLLKYVHKFSMN